MSKKWLLAAPVAGAIAVGVGAGVGADRLLGAPDAVKQDVKPAVELPLQAVVSREISVLGSCASNGEIPERIDLLERGVIDVDPIISLRAPLDEGPDLFARLYRGDSTLMKVIIQP